MTRREFDAATACNWGLLMSLDERDAYRRERGMPGSPRQRRGSAPMRWWWDPLERRRLDTERARQRDPGWATLGLGSRYRAPACWRLLGRAPTLPMTFEERRAAGLTL